MVEEGKGEAIDRGCGATSGGGRRGKGVKVDRGGEGAAQEKKTNTRQRPRM